MNHASHWLLPEAQVVAALEGWTRLDALREVFEHVAEVDEFTLLALQK